MTDHHHLDDLDVCQSMIDKILSIPDRHPYLISTTIQLVDQLSVDAIQDPENLINKVWSQYEHIHKALCSLTISNADRLSEPISPISFEFMDIDDVEDRTATVHSISQIHPQAHPAFEHLMKLEFQPVIDLVPVSSVISMSARPIIDNEEPDHPVLN
jgi:hypothetical protein